MHMPDLLLIPAIALLALAVQAVRRGHHRRHGHLMAAALGCLLLRGGLAFPGLAAWPRGIGAALLCLMGGTALLGRAALAWREGDTRFARLPRLHRAAGALSLLCLALALVAWVLARWA